MSFDRGTLGFGKLAAVIASAALIAGATACGSSNPPQAGGAPSPSTSVVPAAPSSAPAIPSTSSAPSGAEGDDSSDTPDSSQTSTHSASTESSSTESSSETPPASSQPSDITCATFNSLGVGSQRDTLSRIARTNPGSPLEKYPDAYLNNVRATCSQDSQASKKVLEVLSLDGTKYKAQ